MSKELTINKLFRTLRSGDDEAIEFYAGVNVIVGPQNSGKSTWRSPDSDWLECSADGGKTGYSVHVPPHPFATPR